MPQSYWIYTENHHIKTKLMRLENIDEEVSILLGRKVIMKIFNQSVENPNKYIDYYTDELKELVYKKHMLDFELFGYTK